jgi:hypothetical protein
VRDEVDMKYRLVFDANGGVRNEVVMADVYFCGGAALNT